MTILVTGAAGAIGSELMARLPGFGWEPVGFDRRPLPGCLVGDITRPADLDAAMADRTAVVHLAGQPTEAPWQVVRDANIEGTFQVFEAARRAGIARIVYASSNHAAGFTPLADELPADVPARPDTLYGLSKAFGESLGRYYADRYGMQIACLRIGTFARRPPGDERSLSTWLSPQDCARLVDACLRSPRLSYALVWGVSANRRRRWSLAEGAELGYRPCDDAETYRDGEPASGGSADISLPTDALVGGGFASAGFGIDEVAQRWHTERAGTT